MSDALTPDEIREILFQRDMALYGEMFKNAETGERIDPAKVYRRTRPGVFEIVEDDE